MRTLCVVVISLSVIVGVLALYYGATAYIIGSYFAFVFALFGLIYTSENNHK